MTETMKSHRTSRVAQKAVLFRGDGTILALRRSNTDSARPLQWDLPGGELEYGEDAIEAIVREVKEETGLDASDLQAFDIISRFNPLKEFWVTICYHGKPVSTDVVLSYEHDMYRWVSPTEFQELTNNTTSRNREFVSRFKTLLAQRKV